MSDREVLIRCENVGKKFCRDFKKSLWYGVTDSLRDLMGAAVSPEQPLRQGEFWANQNINFEVRRGDCLALLGRNGAGKTTLLKMINGLIRPDSGEIRLKGVVSGLIALGAGFDPILTGRENIFVNGSILGLSRRQISDVFEQIVDFAELSDSIDAPVRTYSSGMQVRLGFSAAVHLIKPDVLLLDEVLAVGDVGFAVKCLNAVRELTNRCAVVFVTHTMQHVSAFCNHAMLMEHGTSTMFSKDVSSVIDRYHSLFSLSASECGTGEATIGNVTLSTDDPAVTSNPHIGITHGSSLSVQLKINTRRPAIVKIYVMSQNLIPLIASDLLGSDGKPLLLSAGCHSLSAELGKIEFNAGVYPLVIAAFDSETEVVMHRVEAKASLRVCSETADWGFISRKFPAVCESSIAVESQVAASLNE
jgi:lipopolysaccharide transport system ATP-binding protein